jgi:stage V sporulation protein G
MKAKVKAMTVTAEVKKLFSDEGKAKAILTLNIGGLFIVRGARLVDGAKGMFVSMPSRRVAAGEYKAICFPITEDFRVQILDAAKAAYGKALAEQENDGGSDEPDAA